MVRKIIKTPYDLNPNNYIYMVIPNLNHIKSVQNNEIEGAFAKVLLPGDSNQTLFSSFVAGTKIFYNKYKMANLYLQNVVDNLYYPNLVL